jgi:hypothetical protein
MLWINGVYTGNNIFSPIVGEADQTFPITTGSQISSIWLEDAGLWPTLPANVIQYLSWYVEADEAITAQRLQMAWQANYELLPNTPVDSQIAVVSITGAKRGVNTSPVPGYETTRGRLTYSIVTTGSTHIVRWWSNTNLVAEGSIVGDGSLTCSALNNSGLTVECILTYTADLAAGEAPIDLRWPAIYYIYYNTEPLDITGGTDQTPQATVIDDGGDNYIYLSPIVNAGTYNWNVLTVDDEGVLQTTGIPITVPMIVNTVPRAPTIVGVTGNATALTLHWEIGENNCTYKVYSSEINFPVNYGDYPLPAPIVSALNATSATLPAISDYAPIDWSTEWTSLLATVDGDMVTLNTYFSTGEGALTASIMNAITLAINTSIATFGNLLHDIVSPLQASVSAASAILVEAISLNASQGYSTSQWQTQMTNAYGYYLAMIGMLMNRNASRYLLPNGAVPMAAAGGITVGVGASTDGTAATLLPPIPAACIDFVTPMIQPGYVRLCVQAVKGGVEETNGVELVVEFDVNGDIVGFRPNNPSIFNISVTNGFDLAVRGQVISDNAAVVPTQMNLYVESIPASPPPFPPMDISTPVETVSLDAPINNQQQKVINYSVPVPSSGAGWYRISLTVNSETSTDNQGEYSSFSAETLLYLCDINQMPVNNLTGKVIRGLNKPVG